MGSEMKVSDIKGYSALYTYIHHHEKQKGEIPSAIVLPEKVFDRIVNSLPFPPELAKQVFACEALMFLHVPVLRSSALKSCVRENVGITSLHEAIAAARHPRRSKSPSPRAS
jgi:hypothetical protein